MISPSFHYKSKLLRLFPKWVEAFTFRSHVFVRGFTLSTKLKRHEAVHVEQYNQYGTINFLVQYFYQNIRYGYIANKFEVAARRGELR